MALRLPTTPTRRLLLVSAGCLGALTLGFALWWLPRHEPVRSYRLAQRRPLVDGIAMQVKDLYLYPCSLPAGHFNFLRVYCRYLGGDPNQGYYLHASVRASADGPEIDPSYVWQVGAVDDHKGGLPMMWEFRTAPEDVKKFFMWIYFRPITKTPGAPAPDQYVDYEIPYLPKLTPNGEVGA